MMKRCLVLILILTLSNVVLAQQILLTRIIAFTADNDDQGKQIIRVDSNTFLARVNLGSYSYGWSATTDYCPAFINLDSNFNIRDTVVFRDTTRLNFLAYNSKKKNIWLVSRDDARFPYAITLRRLDISGSVLAYNRLLPDTQYVAPIPANIYGVYPDESGGFYLLGSRETIMNNQGVEPWTVSRFDSSGIPIWQRDYIFTYAYGRPQHLEVLPSGQIWVSGFAGSEIFALTLDTSTGSVLQRNVIYNYPGNYGWSQGYAVRGADGGYFVTGYNNRSLINPDSGAVMAYVNAGLRLTWEQITAFPAYRPIAIRDSTFWIMHNDSIRSYSYEHYDVRGNRLHKIIIFRGGAYASTSNGLNDVAHNSDGTAAFIGTVDARPYTGGALYFCKISRIGLPYNPTYPAWPPLPPDTVTSTAALIPNEPALQLYPNPGSNALHISHSGSLYMYNAQGSLVIQTDIQAGGIISTSSLPAGCYLVKLHSLKGWLTTKWMKE